MLKRVERLTLCSAIGVAALVLVLAFAARNDAVATAVPRIEAAASESNPGATLVDHVVDVSPVAASPSAGTASAPTTKLPVELPKTRGTLAVRLHAGYEPRPDWVVYLTASVVGAGDEKRVTQQASLESQITYFDGVWPGDVVLRVDCIECAPSETHVPVVAGFTNIVDVKLDCRPPAGWVDVTVRSQSGKFHETIEVVNVASNGEFENFGSVDWNEVDGTFVGRFFTDLSKKGEVELRLMPYSDFGLAPSNRVLARPGQVIELVVQDLAPRIALGFRVIDADTGAQVDDFDAQCGKWTDVPPSRRARSNEIVVEDWPEGGTLTWQISKRGYACAEGTLQDATVISDGNNRWITVALQRGRLLRVRAFGCSQGVIAGATVFADDVEIGRTNSNGEFELFLPVPPKTVDVRSPSFSRCTNRPAPPDDFNQLSPCATLFFYLMRN